MKNLLFALLIFCTVFIGGTAMIGSTADARPCIFQDCDKFVTRDEYKADQVKFGELLEQTNYDVQEAVAGYRAVKEAEPEVKSEAALTIKDVAAVVADTKDEEPDRPLLYAAISAAFVAAGYGGYRHYAYAVAKRALDTATGKTTATA